MLRVIHYESPPEHWDRSVPLRTLQSIYWHYLEKTLGLICRSAYFFWIRPSKHPVAMETGKME